MEMKGVMRDYYLLAGQSSSVLTEHVWSVGSVLGGEESDVRIKYI